MKASDHIARFPDARVPRPHSLISLGCLSALMWAAPAARSASIDPALESFTSQLPVVVLDLHGTGPLTAGETDRPVWFEAFSPATTAPMFATNPLISIPATARVRSASSPPPPKQSLSVQLLDDRGRPASSSLFGLTADHTWDLAAPWNYDRTFLRNAVVYSLSRSLGRWAPRTQFIELFTHTADAPLSASDYAGIGVLTERITVDATHVNLAVLSPSDITAPNVAGGYLLKLDNAGASDTSFTTPHLGDWAPRATISISHPAATDVPAAQRDYIRNYVLMMEAALYADAASGWATRKHLLYLDRASWVDYHLLQVLTGNVDAFQCDVYFTKDRDGKLAAGPVSCFDRALGSADPHAIAWNQWNASGVPDPWTYGWWGLLARDPDFMQAWIDRWQQLRRRELSTDHLTTLAGNLAAQIGPQAAARDAARWPDNTGRFADGWAGEVAQLKTWITNRAAWIDAKFVATPKLESDGVLLSVTAPAGTKLIYTLDGSDPRGPNGQVALTARTASGPLVIDATALLCIRAWSPAPVSFPGSPWSAPLTRDDAHMVGAETNPAFQSRLANLSSFVRLSPNTSAPLTGLVVTGDKEKQILVRAIGPGLKQFGLTGALADPVLSILNSRGTELAHNAGWTRGPDALDLPSVSTAAGAFPLPAGSADSALLLRLAPGSYTIAVSSASGATGTALTEVYELDRTGSLASLSTCATVDAAAPVLAGGFIVRGSAPQKFLVRASGPGLAQWGVTGTLADPIVAIATSTGIIARNDDWSSGTEGGADAGNVAATANACGAFPLPSGGRDAALVVTLTPGAYTAQVTSKDGTPGVVLLEVYGVP